MKRETVRETFREIIEAIKKSPVDGAGMADDAYLGGDLGMDSIEILEAIVDLQKRFSISIPKEELGELYAVKDVLDLVLRHGMER